MGDGSHLKEFEPKLKRRVYFSDCPQLDVNDACKQYLGLMFNLVEEAEDKFPIPWSSIT